MRIHRFTLNRKGELDHGKLLHRGFYLHVYAKGERKSWSWHAEVILQRPRPEFGLRFHVGTLGSETPWDGHLTVLGSGIYWGFSGLRRLAERITREKLHKYEGRDLSLRIFSGSLWWSIWTHPNRQTRGEFAKWREASIRLNPLDRILGSKLYSYEDVETAIVALELGDGTYPVSMTLRRSYRGRRRGRRRFEGWIVEWDAPKGIPTEPDSWKGGSTYGASFAMPRFEHRPSWPITAQNRLAAWVFTQRASHGFPAPTAIRAERAS